MVQRKPKKEAEVNVSAGADADMILDSKNSDVQAAEKTTDSKKASKKKANSKKASSKKSDSKNADSKKVAANKNKKRNRTELLELTFQSIFEEAEADLVNLVSGKKDTGKALNPEAILDEDGRIDHFLLVELAEEKAPKETKAILKEIPQALFTAWCEYLAYYEPNIRNSISHVIERRLRRMKVPIPLDYRNRESEDEYDVFRRRRKMVDVSNYYTFMDTMLSSEEYQESFLCWLFGLKKPSVYQYDYIVRWIKEHKGSKKDWDGTFYPFHLNFAGIYADAVDEIFGEHLHDFYPIKEKRADFEAALDESELYHGVAEKAELRRSMDRKVSEALVQSIPEDYTQLFPLARQMKRRFILHVGGTNSGKTYQAMEAMKKAKSGIYLAPLRLLAFEKFEEMNMAGVPCSMVTGEEEIAIPFAEHQSSTVDVLPYTRQFECAVIDECQMLEDHERGGRWTNAILGVCAEEVHLCLAPHGEKAVVRLIEACGDEYTIERHIRKTPLIVEKDSFDLDKTEQGDALIVFSKKDVHAVAAELQAHNVPASVVYGALPYSVRQNEATRFRNKETKVVVATDAIGMGMNLPIRRVIFLNTEKYDGITKRPLRAEEIQQIAGRAGRYGMYEKGFVNVQGMSKKALRKKLTEAVPDIDIVRISFPESLKGIDAPLSTIFARWNSLTPREGFLYTNMDREQKLAIELERLTDNKELIYCFVTMAFDEEDPALHDLWKTCFNYAMDGKDLPVDDMTQACLAVGEEMNELEKSFRHMDLLYQCQRLRSKDSEEIAKIIRCKELISDRIIKILQEQKLAHRTCKRCGREVPWNYKFGICQRCFDKEYGRKSDYGWY